MATPFLLRLEIFNELCILFSSYHLFLFTVFVPDAYTQYDIGYSHVAIALICVLVNMSLILFTSLRTLKF